MDAWFALHCRSQRELQTAEDLRKDGYDVFVPTETVIKQARNAKHHVPRDPIIRPLVTGYVFCDHPWHDHKHVYGCIMAGDKPYSIPHAHMLPLFQATGRERHEGQQAIPLTIGQVVQVDGLPVTVAKMVGKRVQVIVRLFGGERRTIVDRERIAA